MAIGSTRRVLSFLHRLFCRLKESFAVTLNIGALPTTLVALTAVIAIPTNVVVFAWLSY
jgi:hypothetical protein